MLVSLLAFTALSLFGTGMLTFAIQFDRMHDQLNDELLHQVAELQMVADKGPTPDQEWPSLNELYERFLQTYVPGRDENMITLADGQLLYQPAAESDVDITAEVIAHARSVGQRGRTVQSDFTSGGRTLRLAVADVHLPIDARHGQAVVAIDLQAWRSDLFDQLRTYLLISTGVLLASGVAAWLLTGRLLRPLARLRATSALVSAEDLGRRVDVGKDTTDVTDLALGVNQMLDRLERSFADQRQFLDDAAHELRTPLTIIRGNVELVDPQDPDDVRQTSELVLDELDRMQRLVDDLLLLARSQRPDFIHAEAVQVDDLLGEAFARAQHLGERHWTLDAHTAATVQGDRQRLLQLLLQLASNAVRHTTPQDTVEIGAGRESGAITLWVRDTGEGIDLEDQAKIFERFVRTDQARGEGTGLGLAIVKAVAEGHSGSVSVSSAPGVGSRFIVTLPETR